ncbi:YolD-like family protein [Salicibibacter kimchii]|uniref:YolD-like family protein n=1 Tax=Salicibibacter kimchii TaxID=2099786 RepID=A0A345BUL0_9BACI|nr:YolD-like family protein [Salicibibacter kimchii]AXF54641.1 YolD-like family protein [Salicibibacter kimchii]
MNENKLTPGSNMRWESMRMILPEHRERWLQHRESMKKVEKPVLDEQKWEEIERTINEAMEYGSLLEFTYWEDGFFYSIVGVCERVNVEQKQFHIIDGEDDIHYLKFDVVTNIHLV